MANLTRFVEGKLKLTVNRRKSRGRSVDRVIGELRRYAVGWLNYFGISHTYKVLLELDEWVRRHARLYYWKQWKQLRTRKRHLLALGIHPA